MNATVKMHTHYPKRPASSGNGALSVLLALTVIVVANDEAAEIKSEPAAVGESWVRPELNDPRQVLLSGPLGDALSRGLGRIGQEPYHPAFILADVSFATNRWFTNYSGDISGRFLELASVTSQRGDPQPAALPTVLEQITRFQKPDGHFGAEVNWTNAAELHGPAWDSKIMPIFWGNGRLLLGLTASYVRFGDAKLLASARRLGDFYATTAADVFCDPRRADEYRQAAAYAGAFVTCYFEGMEGLVQLYRLTRDRRYLETALRMADFHEAFDTLPVGHAHGSLSQHEALLMLYEETGQAKYLERVVARWEAATTGGYVSPAGGVMEKFVVSGYARDEGCAEADWLRVCLMLWRHTGRVRYLDMAERTVWNEYFANQWPDGGFGHRNLGVDQSGPYAFDSYSEEALWCCTFHGPLALNEFKSYLAVAANNALCYNFPVDFVAPVTVSNTEWTVRSLSLPPTQAVPVRCEVRLTERSGRGAMRLFVRVPEWAEEIGLRINGSESSPEQVGGYLRTKPLRPGTVVQIDYHAHPYLETRRFERVKLPAALPARLDQVVVRFGPNVMVNPTSGRITDLALSTKHGVLELPAGQSKLTSWADLRNSAIPHAFVFNVSLTP
jgi:DUF1680 family protein